jgi:anti-sigma regulatory factor (Ser/Thr protein kinase)
MSDVLAFGKPNSALLTGLATQQAVISAHMAEFKGVVFIRGKRPKDGAEKFARENNLVMLTTDLDMYDACVKIDSIDGKSGSGAQRGAILPKREDMLLNQEFHVEGSDFAKAQEFHVEGSDFAKAGMASTQVKSMLKKIGVDPKLVRRVAISTFEGEMNVVMHAVRATIFLVITPKFIEVIIDDEGKGIPDVALAMESGFTTATEEMRAMGFGSGMGLPNIKKNTDEVNVTSEIGIGTRVWMKFLVNDHNADEGEEN